MSEKIIEIDGSMGEGGGQILRTSLALSVLTGKPFRLFNIRAGRPKPGLQPQHLMGVQAAATIGQASVRGASKGSCDLYFEPGQVKGGNYHFAIGTAGATGLVLQTIYLPLVLGADCPSEVVISGGTHVKAAPCFHFLATTWCGYLSLMGMKVHLTMDRPGFYPRGGGVIKAKMQPCGEVQGLNLASESTMDCLTGFSAVSDLPEDIAQRQARRARKRLESCGHDIRVDLREERWHGGPGTVLALILNSKPVPTMFFALGERGKKAERVADDAVDETLAYLNSGSPVVDPHSADQIVLPLALSPHSSSYRVSQVTRHLHTNISVIQKFLDRTIQCLGEEGEAGEVRIK